MYQHNTSRLRSQQPMVRPLYLQELNLSFYTFLSPSQEYFSFVHLGVATVNKQSCSFKENCCKNGCTQQNFIGFQWICDFDFLAETAQRNSILPV